MIFTMIFTFIAVMTIAALRNWIFVQSMPGYTTGYTHGVLGMATIAIMFLNPIIAVFRPDPEHEKRWIFNSVHGFLGRAARSLSIVTIIYGLNIVNGNQEISTWKGYFAWIIVWGGFEGIIMITIGLMKEKASNRFKTVAWAFWILLCCTTFAVVVASYYKSIAYAKSSGLNFCILSFNND